jgi:hypothetical protein
MGATAKRRLRGTTIESETTMSAMMGMILIVMIIEIASRRRP